MSESVTTSDEDEDSREERSSDEETGSEGGSESGSGSGSDESGSDSDDPSSGSSGSGSGEEGDSSSSADDSDVVSDEKESDKGDEEKKAANKREDFEKMKELSAHMDNIVQRFENLFPFHESREGTTPLPKVPPLPQPDPVKNSRYRSVSARPMTVDRAVSARRLTTDRAVSVASGFHFDDELSGSAGSNTKRVESAERRRRGRRRATAAHRRSSGDRGGGRNGAKGTQKHELEASAAQRGSVRTESSSERDRSDNVDKRDPRARQPGSRKARGGWQAPRDDRGPGLGAHGWHERLLWDELRDSLAGVAGGERAMRSKWSRDGGGDVVEEARGDGASKEQQRRLIDEAIAVLLEGSSSDEEGAMETS